MKINEKDILDFKKNITMNDEVIKISDTSFNMDKPSISILIIVKNEERTIKRCINSVLNNIDESDELIIADTGSKDKTIEIIKSFKQDNIKLLHFQWNNDFSEARNFTKEYAKKDWIFFIDADEYLADKVIEKLKKYICILKRYTNKNIFINPTIANTNDHIINGVTRIFENKSKIRFKGLIHEYPYLFGEETFCYAFESILIIHDGYDEKLIDMDQKIERNMQLLAKMKRTDENIRWDYLYCRDGSYKWSQEEQKIHLEKLLEKWIDEKESDIYYSATRDLVELYLINGEINKAKIKIDFLKTLKFNESDILYFDSIIKWSEIKLNESKILNELIKYRKTRENIDYGALHSNYFHIDFLISQLMFSQGELEKSYQIQKKLNEKGVFNYTIDFKQILNIASNLDGEV